ncbi:MAG TPA: RNase H-like domain-containing protein, partial [Candidatus Limnocylindrales bacterium]|nr:RNase H-like domain-containing protein [Candidatus Limnocylindrales bacterium]
ALGIPINWKKVKICVDQITYCGYSITNEGITQDQTRVKALSRLRPPSSFAELDIFMGMANCHREFIKDYASEMKPLLDLQNYDRRRSKFSESFKKVHLNTFRRFIFLIQQKTLLTRPGEGEYHIYTDMSEKFKTLSAQLIRVHDGKRYLVSYASKRLSETESIYSTPKLEMMAIWYGLMKFKMIVNGRKVKVFTDHRSLQGLHLKDPRKRWATWLTDIIEINPEVIHVSGKDNPVADAMTRLSDWANSIIVQRQETRADIVRNYHHHFSDRKTVMNIRDKYNWDGIYSDVAKFRESCEYCQKNRGADASNPMTPIIPERLWQIIGIDIKGPITLKNNERKQYGIAVDYFSKNTFIFPLNSYTSKEFWEKFEKNVLDRISTPQVIIGDSAKQFLCGEAALYKDKYNFTFQPSSACRHQANGEVENKIKFVDNLMHSYLSRGVGWRESIRSTLKVVNHEVVNDSTLHTPYEIVHGQKFLSPFDVKVQMQIDELSKLHNEVRSNIDLSKAKQQYYYDKGTKKVCFKENDWVLVYDNYRKGYQTDKRTGPFKVEKALANDNYLIYNHLLATWRQYNADKLKLFVPMYDGVQEERVEIPSFDDPLLPSQPDPYPRDPAVAGVPVREPAVAVLPPLEPAIVRVPLVPLARADEVRVEGATRYALRSRVDLPGTINDKRYRPSSSGK